MKKLLISLVAILALLTPCYAKDSKATLINEQGTKVVVASGSAGADWYFKLGYTLMTNMLGASIYQTPALFETSLASALSATATSTTLVSGITRDGTALSGNYCFTIDSGLNTAEYVCGTATGASISSLQRGIGSDGITSYSGLKYAHRYGSDVKITDFPVLNQLGRIINGQDSFPNIVKYDSSVASTSFSNGQQLISKSYADGLSYNGSPVAQEGTKGIVDLATRAQMANGSSAGTGSSSLVLQSKYASSTSVVNNVVITNSNGKIDPTFLNGTENYTFGGNNTFSGSNTYSGTNTFTGTTVASIVKGYTAGETLNGATSPIAVYLKSDGTVASTTAAATSTTFGYIGFAITTATSTNTVYVQTEGVVNGFTGLTAGSIYYLGTTYGSATTTAGTYSLSIGKAISTTQILLQRGRAIASGTASYNSSVTNTFSLGFKPSKVLIFASASQGTAANVAFSSGGWDASSGNTSNNYYVSTGCSALMTNAFCISTANNSNSLSGVVAATATGFTLTNTLAGTQTAQVRWIAEE